MRRAKPSGKISAFSLAIGRWSRRWARLGFTAFNALFYAAAHYTTALNLSLIQACIPALVLIGAAVAFRARASFLQALGALLTILGVAEIAAQGDWRVLAKFSVNLGDAMMLLASLFYAFYTLALRKRPSVSGFGFLAAMAIAALVTSIPLFVVEVATSGFIVPTLEGLARAALRRARTRFPRPRALHAGRRVDRTQPAVCVRQSRAGVSAHCCAVLLLGEPFAAYHLIALGLVVAGIVIAQRRSRV